MEKKCAYENTNLAHGSKSSITAEHFNIGLSIRLVQSNNATFGNWPDWSYWYSVVAESVSFPLVHHTLSKSEI